MSRRAFTLAEVLVVGALATLMLGVMIYLFVSFGREAEKPLSSLSMEQSTVGILRWLQRDLAETNLQSVESLPQESGVRLESPRDPLNDMLQFSDFGTVLWQKHVTYQVVPISTPSKPLPSGVQLGALNYDESTQDIGPEPKIAFKGVTNIPSRHRVLGQSFAVQPGTRLGLNVYWMDEAGAPQPFTATGRGEPVCVALSLLEVSGRTGKPTTRRLFMQVTPKN